MVPSGAEAQPSVRTRPPSQIFSSLAPGATMAFLSWARAGRTPDRTTAKVSARVESVRMMAPGVRVCEHVSPRSGRVPSKSCAAPESLPAHGNMKDVADEKVAVAVEPEKGHRVVRLHDERRRDIGIITY